MKIKFGSFTLHRLEGYIADLYLAEYSDSIFLLDCGCRSDRKKIAAYITDTMQRPIEELKLLVVTHLHPDHSGSATSLSRQYNIPIAASPEVNLWYKGIGGLIQHLVDLLLAHISARSRKMKLLRIYYPGRIPVEYPLKDGDSLPFFPDWEIVSVPGHTEHDIVLYNRKESFLYCSDTMIKIRGKYLSPFPVTDKIKMARSLARIGKLEVKTFAMAHGGVSENENFSEITSNLITALDRPLTGVLKFFYPLTLFSGTLKKNKSHL